MNRSAPARFVDERRLAMVFGAGVLFVLLATTGGRIASSDGHTMFLLTESLVERGTVAVPEGNTEAGPDGRLYPKAGLGQALVSAPFFAAGRMAAGAFPPAQRPFVVRAVTSLASVVAGALLALLLVLLFQDLGLTPREALALAGAAIFATPLWVYAQLYVGEIWLALGVALTLRSVLHLRRGGGARSSLGAALGLGLAVLVKYAIAPVAVLVAAPGLAALRRWRAWLPGAVLLFVLASVAFFYNETRTGSALGTGYGRQGTLGAFTTPIWVGLYGLLLSSGKGLAWFAPLVVLAPAGFVAWWRRDRGLAAGALAGVAVHLLLHAGFEHWAGDGSWGPRYLVPLVPLLVTAIAARLGERTLPRRRLWWVAVGVLSAAGFAVQIGGAFIYFGAQMREAGDYPYTLSLDDPRFMSESHWNPRFSPILGHWRMLGRNLGEHLEGDWPRIRPRAAAGRLGLGARDTEALTHGLDVWAAYAIYAGQPARWVLAIWGFLWLIGLAYLLWAWRDAGRLAPRPRRRRDWSRPEHETGVDAEAAMAAGGRGGTIGPASDPRAVPPAGPPPPPEPASGESERRGRWSFLGGR